MKPDLFRKLKRANRRGVTLVEVMLSAAILGILAILLINALFYPTRLVVTDTRRQLALSAANEEMETVRMIKDYAAVSNASRTISALNQTLTLNRTVVTTTTNMIPIKTITVTVKEASGKTNVVLVTQRALYP